MRNLDQMALPGVAPMTINFMLNCYFSPKPQEQLGHAHWNSPAGIRTRQWLLDNGLVGDDFRATGRGVAWVDFICATPLPVSKWVLPERSAYAYGDEGSKMEAEMNQ